MKIKILVSAYACSPYHGSEPGMGWNFVYALSKYHDLHVIVEKLKWEEPIRKHLELYPDICRNVTFHFIKKKRAKHLRKFWPPSYYWFYKTWQKEAYELALSLNKRENFDLIHQLNMAGFREPGYLWKIDKPFVWGPVGGLENTHWKYLYSLGIKGFIFFLGRNVFNYLQRKYALRPRLAASRMNSAIIAATPGNQQLIKKLWGVDSSLICEVGRDESTVNKFNKLIVRNDNLMRIVWSGEHIPRKNLPLLLRALKDLNLPIELHILGIGNMTNRWKALSKELNIAGHCTWHGYVDRDKALEIMSECHVYCNTSIYDLTSTVILEALTLGLPTICLNQFGFAHVVTEECGIKIPVDTMASAQMHMREALSLLYTNESYRQKLSQGAFLRAEKFNWQDKILELNDIYRGLIPTSRG